jgi:ABC-type sugar transport system substrate-binding protein
MKRMMWLVLVLLLIVAMLSFAGGRQEGKEEGPVRITFVTPLLAHPVWDNSRMGFEDAARDLGFEGQYVGPQGLDTTAMIDQIETAIIEGVDGIITFAMDPTAFEPVLKKAEEKGITVVLVFSEVEGVDNIAKVGTSEVDLGRNGAQEVLRQLGDTPPKVIYMGSQPTHQFPEKVRSGYEEVLSEVPGYEVLAMEYCNSDMIQAMEKFEALYRTYPEVTAVIGVCGEAGPAAAKVAKEFGIVDDLYIMAIDAVDETKDLIRDGSIEATMEQNFYGVGYISAQVIYDFVTTGKTPKTYDIDSGSFPVTKENVDSLQDGYSAVMEEILDKI